jgi:integrase
VLLARLLPNPVETRGVTVAVAVRFYNNERALPAELRLSPEAATAIERVRSARYRGQPFVLDDAGRPDVVVNAFFASRHFRSYAESTRRKYAWSLGLWLTFCTGRAVDWRCASPDDVADFKFWRMTDEANPTRVQGSAVHADLAAISALYRWAVPRKRAVSDPVVRVEMSRRRWDATGASSGRAAEGAPEAEPAGVRDRNVKWLAPAAVTRWIDVALRGLDLDGREAPDSRNRTGSRDAAFAHLLYGSGLRLREGASLLLCELPDDDDPGRAYWSLRLAAACAKGHRGRMWWLPRQPLGELLTYLEGQRPLAVAQAQAQGRYEQLTGVRVIEQVQGARRLVLSGPRGGEHVSLDELSPAKRLRVFRRTDAGLEPAMLWLNENGLPRPMEAWSATFRTGNERVARQGLGSFVCTPHMLRHSFALRWYSVGRLLWDRRLAHLTVSEQQDFRAQFGDTWHLVQTLLGHRHPQTTVDIYLEPFKSLEVELLLEYAAQVPLSGMMRVLFNADHRVVQDPIAGTSVPRESR